MSQPPVYNRLTSFSNLQALNPTGQPPGNSMDAEYDAIKTTLDATLADLKLIQNDDGTVANQSIGPAQLSAQLVLGFNAPSAWVTAHTYNASPASTVLHGTGLYICLISHTSGVFATDLAAGKWLLVLDLSTLTFGTASQISVVTDGGLVTSDVQTSLNALDSGKAATSHTHTASQISDSTTAGRNMLTAANVAAQQSLLGLGSLAFLSSVPATTIIPSQLSFTGNIGSGALATSQNDFAPTGWSSNAVLRLTSSATISITGFAATTDGDIKYVQNVGTFVITLVGNSGSSSAANRIALLGPLALFPGQAALLQYDGTAALWRVMSPIGASPPLGSLRNLRVGNVANGLGDSAPSAPNTQAYINADEIVLEDANASAWRVSAVALTVDATVVGANGIDAGALGASTWYSIWVIANPTTNTAAGLVSTSATTPTLPSGYTFKARVGWMRTDGSSHFLKTLQMGRKARYSGTLPTITSGTNAGAAISVVNFIPSTAPAIVVVLFGTIPAGTEISVGATSATSPALAAAADLTGAGNIIAQSTVEILLEATSVYYTSGSGAGPGIACYGWEDNI